MKNISLALLFCLLLSSCQKTIESITEDLLVQVMTSGNWKMTNFTSNGTDKTADFNGYVFQFYNNNTVDARKNSVLEKNGTWSSNTTNKTITANFGNLSTPLSLINGLWQITNSSLSYVEATQTVGNETKTLRLDKI